MKKNVGGVDRMFRFGVGFMALMIVTVSSNLLLQVLFGVVAVAGLLTSIAGYCPINDKLHVDTTAKK
jgi:hypothetical protein